MEKLFFVPDGSDTVFYGNTLEEIFDELDECDVLYDDVFKCGYLVDTETMTVNRAEFGYERKRVINIQQHKLGG